MKRILTDIIGVAVLVALFIACNYAWYRKGFKKGENEAVERLIFVHDTTTVYKEITAYKPVPFNVYVVDTLRVPVPVPGKADTLYAELPREHKTYAEDSLYVCEISGVQPELESITVFQKTQYINNTVYVPTKDTRKDYIELDARLMWDKQFLAPVTLNIGHKFGPLDVYAGGGYDFLQKAPIGQVGGKLQFKF